MRIGINASFLRKPGTGIGQVTLNFLEQLKTWPGDESVEFFVYTEEEWGGSGYSPRFHFRNFLPWWKRDDLIRKILWERHVAQEAKKDGCDIFLSLYQSTTIFPQGIHHVMVVHDVIPRLFPEYQGNWRKWWYWRSVEQGIRHASSIIAVSEATQNDLVEFGINRDQIVVAYPDTAPIFLHQPSLETAQAVLEKYALEPGYLYHGGGLEVRKNTERLLLAYKLLVEKEKSGAMQCVVPLLVISGKIFSESNVLATPVRSIIKKLALEDRVRLLDFVPEEDLPALYQNALFFVYPSLYEGFGLPVLEALRMGTPVLTSDVSSLPEVAHDAALYIDPESVSSIASGMERLITDAALRETLQELGLKQLPRFSWKQFLQVVMQVVKK
jgi:glycosyltransferase involved in cell wall biosynthesis